MDVGSGSGLFSLAARGLGATVHSFDYDAGSVACSKVLRERYFAGDSHWTVESGSALDLTYLAGLGRFDVVYSWGVLHHTGDMWRALEYIQELVGEEGKLVVSIYNDQGWISKYWRFIKRQYNRDPLTRGVIILAHIPYLMGVRFVVRLVRGKLRLERGMSLWYDMLDWLGGYPFEVARPKDLIDLYQQAGFSVVRCHTCGRRHGCNEFVFAKLSQSGS